MYSVVPYRIRGDGYLAIARKQRGAFNHIYIFLLPNSLVVSYSGPSGILGSCGKQNTA